MKISADPTHSAYHHAISTCRVFLEGAERCNVIFADEEGRRATTIRLDEWGKPIWKDDKMLKDEFWGSVRIECPQWVREQCDNPEMVTREVAYTLVGSWVAGTPARKITRP
jgi:hypothetical protein